MAIVMFALSHHLRDIKKIKIKYQKFDLENEGQDQREEKLDLRYSTGNVRFHMGDFSEF